jgi:hypothetical protein
MAMPTLEADPRAPFAVQTFLFGHTPSVVVYDCPARR